MKITEELLRKYYTGNCTEAEKRRVREWINSTADEESELSERDTFRMKENTWKIIEKRYGFGARSAFQISWQQVGRYAAACVLVLLGAIFLIQNEEENATQVTTNDGGILAFTGNGKSTVIKDNCEIDFTISLQLKNNSDTYKTIVCLGKNIRLRPHQMYRITKSNENLNIQQVKNLMFDGNQTPFSRSNFSLSCL